MAGYTSVSKGFNFATKADTAKFKSHLITILQKSTAMPFRRHDNQYKCFYCDGIFILPSKLKQHTTQKHKYMDFSESLKIWTEFNLESSLMVDIQDLSCKVCNAIISDMNELKIHFSVWHNEAIPTDAFNNVVCFKLFDDTLKCFFCKEEFESFRNLLQHMKTHTHLSCETCGSNFNSKRDFSEHEQTNCKPCHLCDMRFQSKNQRDAHLKLMHCKGFQCDFCSQQFTLKTTLARHIRNIHYKEKNGTCDVCGKTFFDRHNLNLHKVRHSNMKPFECDVCKKKFPRIEALKLHKRIHDNDRRYVCKICGKSFIQWVSLSMHKVVHTDERNFKCPICDKAFKDKKTMGKHCKNVHQKDDIKPV